MAIDQRPRTPLQEAVAWRDLERVRAVLAEGAEIDQVGRLGRTALHLAAATAQPDATALLIESGAQIDPRDDAGNTPLLCAVMSMSKNKDKALVAATVAVLLEHGADPAAANAGAVTAPAFAQPTPLAEQFEPWSGPPTPLVQITGSTPNQAVLAVEGRMLTVSGEMILLDDGNADRVLRSDGLSNWDDGEPVDPEVRELLRCFLIGTGSMLD
jgi:hypothetical protein